MSDNSTPKNILDLACGFFSCDPDQALYQAVQRSSTETLRKFREAYRAFAEEERIEVPDLKKGELRPYIASPHWNGITPPWMHGGIPFYAEDFDNPDNVWAVVDAIKHRLLYCHSVSLDDPLANIAITNPFLEGDDIYRARLANLASFLVHMRPLIERGIISFVPPTMPFVGPNAFKFGLSMGGNRPSKSLPLDSPLMPLLEDFLKSRAQEGFKFSFDEFLPSAPVNSQEWWNLQLKDETGQRHIQARMFLAAMSRIHGAFSPVLYAPGKFTLHFPFKEARYPSIATAASCPNRERLGALGLFLRRMLAHDFEMSKPVRDRSRGSRGWPRRRS